MKWWVKLVKLPLKLLAALLWTVVSILALMIKLVEKCSSILMGLLLLLLAGILIYCLVTASWQNLMICVGLGVAAVLVLFAIEGLLMLLQALRRRIGRFLRS